MGTSRVWCICPACALLDTTKPGTFNSIERHVTWQNILAVSVKATVMVTKPAHDMHVAVAVNSQALVQVSTQACVLCKSKPRIKELLLG
jgi:histidinol phosphatase-like enzyme